MPIPATSGWSLKRPSQVWGEDGGREPDPAGRGSRHRSAYPGDPLGTRELALGSGRSGHRLDPDLGHVKVFLGIMMCTHHMGRATAAT